jgi:hypothetical protein
MLEGPITRLGQYRRPRALAAHTAQRLSAMLSRKYRYLIALAQERHFGRAAASCHVSPSTLSAAIRDLEDELGVAIVERSQTFAGFTAEGQSVLDYARAMRSWTRSQKLFLYSRGGDA